MKYANVFYIPHFNIIGGIETYAYTELNRKVKKDEIIETSEERAEYLKELNLVESE